MLVSTFNWFSEHYFDANCRFVARFTGIVAETAGVGARSSVDGVTTAVEDDFNPLSGHDCGPLGTLGGR